MWNNQLGLGLTPTNEEQKINIIIGDSIYINLPNFPDTLFVPEATRQWKHQNL